MAVHEDSRSSESSTASSFLQKGIAVLLFTLFLNLFFFHIMGPVSFALIVLAVTSLTLFTIPRTSLKKNTTTIAGFTITLALELLIPIIRGNEFVGFVLSVSSLATLILLMYVSKAQIPFVRSLMELVMSPLFLAKQYIVATGEIATSFLAPKQKVEKSTNKKSFAKSAIVGVIIALPILLVLVGLFSAADPIYATFVRKLFSSNFLSDATTRIFWSLLIFLLILPIAVLRLKKEFHSPLAILSRFSFVHEMTVVMALVVITIASFLIIQWPYVFAHVASETSLSQFGVRTYSEYVRRGFVELLFIAVFIYGLIWTGLIALRNETSSRTSWLPKIQLIALAELGIFIISIARRVFLYQELHGGSLVRVYGSFFLVFISFLIITLALRHFMQKRWVIAEVIAAVVMLGILGIFNAEEYIATSNPPTVNNRVDYLYLSRLSADGTTGWKKSYDYASNILNDKNLLEKPLIEKSERQQVAYAGMVVAQLADTYDTLVREYGSDDELRDYLKTIFAEYGKNYEHIPPNVKDDNSYNYLLSKNSYTLLQKKLYTTGDLKSVAYKIYTYYPFLNISFDPQANIANQFYGIDDENMQSFHNSGTHEKYFDSLDKLYVYNSARKNSFEFLKNTMSIEELLDLQRKFALLYKKIANQIPDERTYDMDISLISPLL